MTFFHFSCVQGGSGKMLICSFSKNNYLEIQLCFYSISIEFSSYSFAKDSLKVYFPEIFHPRDRMKSETSILSVPSYPCLQIFYETFISFCTSILVYLFVVLLDKIIILDHNYINK